MRIYLAAPLFTQTERALNRDLARRLERRGHRVFLPQRDAPPARGRGRTRRIYAACRDAIDRADLVVAVCDGATADDGTAWEIGYAVGRGKRAYGLRTDSRTVARDERVNLMIQGSLVRLFRSAPALLRALRARGRRA